MPEQKKYRVTVSEALRRQQGNARYKASKAEGLPSSVVTARAVESLQLYNKAETASSCPSETASASKNVARVALWLVLLRRDSFESLKYHATQAIGAARRARKSGEGLKSPEWMSDVDGICVAAAMELVLLLKGRQLGEAPHLAALQAACHTLRREGLDSGPAVAAVLHYQLSLSSFQAAVRAREEERLLDAHRFLGAIGASLGEAQEAARQLLEQHLDLTRALPAVSEALAGLEELTADIRMECAVVEAYMGIADGDQTMEAALNGDEELNVEGLWAAADMFRAAIVSARERDIEAEAQANSRLGTAWKALCPSLAHSYFKRCVDLGLSLFPRVMTSKAWFKAALKEVEAHQEQVAREEEKETARDAAPYLEKLKEEVKALKRASEKSAFHLLKHIYEELEVEKYIRANEARAVTEKLKMPDTNAEMKKQVQTALLHFHTDKNGAAQYGMLWHVFCSEITKLLNSHYNVLKHIG